MKKALGLFLTCLLALGVLEAASKPSGNVAKNLKKGSIVDGRTANGSLQRWMFLNDSSIGGSWTKIGSSEYISVDLGYSATLTTIATAGGLRGVFGIDFEFPIYVAAKGKSNALTTQNSFVGVLGWGAFVPVSAGIDINGFYIRGLVGYGYNEIKEEFDVGGNHEAILKTRYHGLVYGASVGYRVKNIVNLGVKALFGKMKNDQRSTTDSKLVEIREPKDRRYDLMRIGGYVSIVF